MSKRNKKPSTKLESYDQQKQTMTYHWNNLPINLLALADIFYFYSFTFTYFAYQNYDTIRRDEILIRWCDLGIINESTSPYISRLLQFK